MQSAVPTSAALTEIAYTSLFAPTIWQYRKNRVVALGGIAVMLVFAFMFRATLVNKPHAPSRAAPARFDVSGFMVFLFVVADVIRLRKDQWKAGTADGGPGKHETK